MACACWRWRPVSSVCGGLGYRLVIDGGSGASGTVAVVNLSGPALPLQDAGSAARGHTVFWVWGGSTTPNGGCPGWCRDGE